VKRSILAGAALAVGLAACAQLKDLPGAAGKYVADKGAENAGKVADNTAKAAVSGKLTQKATFSMEQEFYLGKTIAANVVARLGEKGLPPEHPAARYVRDVGMVVALAAADARTPDDRPYPLKGYRFVLVDAPQVNAVGAPGGFVVVTTGALRAVRSEDELAAILAHEIAHVQRGHTMAPVESARQQENITSTMLAGTDKVVHVFFGKVVTLGTDFVLDKGYGKTNELDADAFARDTLARAGYDPGALASFLRRLTGKAAEGGFFSRHPPAADRVAALGQEPGPGAVVPALALKGLRPERFQTRLASVRQPATP
jgi:beta-barrel assembly-enhancing protease